MALLPLSPPRMMVIEGMRVLEMPRNHPALNVGVHTLCTTNQDDSRPTGIFKICVRLSKGTEKLSSFIHQPPCWFCSFQYSPLEMEGASKE